MVKIEDFLTNRQISRIYDHVHKHILDLPYVKNNTWDAFFIIIFLVLIADKKIRPAELGFFNRLIKATFNRNWESANMIKGRIPKEKHLIDIGVKVLSIYEEIRYLGEDSVNEVVKTLAQNITIPELQKVTLLCAVRLAISDLELARYETRLITHLAQSWELDKMLEEIKFSDIKETDHDTFVSKLLSSHNSFIALLDRKGLKHDQYEEIVHLIHQSGLSIPGDELISEEYQLYRSAIGEEHQRNISELNTTHNKALRQRKSKHKNEIKELRTKFKYKRSRFSSVFICQTFLSQLNFHRDCFDKIDEKFESSIIWDILIKLNTADHIGDHIIKPKRIKGRNGWLEIAGISTGKNSMGRVYYHDSQSEKFNFNVYIDFKVDEKSQKKSFAMIDSWKKNGFA